LRPPDPVAAGFERMSGRLLRRIRVGDSSVSSLINSRKRYRVRIERQWYEGTFSKRWFGWQFDDYGPSGIQLNLIDEVYEMALPESVSKPLRKRLS
jgi:hypothetical protein